MLVFLFSLGKYSEVKWLFFFFFNLRILYTVFHRGCINVQYHQQCMRVLFFPPLLHQYLLFIVFLLVVFWLVWSGICGFDFLFPSHDVEHIFMYLLAGCMSLKKYLFSPLTIFIYFFFFLTWTIFKVFIAFVTVLLRFYVSFFFGHKVCEITSLTRDQTSTLCVRRQDLNHWTAREAICWPFFNLVVGFSDAELSEGFVCFGY